MCGRFHIDITEPEWREIIYDVMQKHPLDTIKQGEIFPTEQAPVLITGYERPEAEYYKWGYDKPAGQKGVMINARAETVTEKPMFSRDFLERRCLIPVSGFYEWSKARQKYLYRKPDGLLYLGGFYRRRPDNNTFIILTKDAAQPVAAIHDRIPP